MTSTPLPHARRVAVTTFPDGITRPPDYASAFEVPITPEDAQSPEQWARTMFENAPWAIRQLIQFGWRRVLRMHLGPTTSAHHILGWQIISSEPNTIVLQVQASMMTSVKFLHTDSALVTVTTVNYYERRRARLIWPIVAPIHHRTEPYLLRHALSHGRIEPP